MVHYFTHAPPADAAWAVHFLSGERPKRLISVRRLATWATQASGIPDWLFEECYTAVGDLAETITLLLPESTAPLDRPLHVWIEDHLLTLAGREETEQRDAILASWRELGGIERFVWNKLITGGFRVGVSQPLVIRALSRASGISEGVIAHRLSGTWQACAESWNALIAVQTSDADISKPYPFYLAYAMEEELETLGDASDWQIEWKWDGIRAQLIRRSDQTYLWSRGGELVTDRFPEIATVATYLPNGTVIDGEIMPWANDAPLPFAQLQRRIGRKALGAKILTEVPVVLVAYDLLELAGDDLRDRPLAWRRARLVELLTAANVATTLIVSPTVEGGSWDDVRAAWRRAREVCAEGLMLKRLDGPYGVGRRRGGWWKWKVKPYAVDAVMIYAQAGHGRRASLNTDYTFAVWDGGVLVPFAKAYSGLTDAEIRELDAWIRRNTLEKFGPVRSVKPEQVFELAFEGIQPSPRHKSGVAVRFPRILRWRTDKKPEDADTLATLRALMAAPIDVEDGASR
ncbi:MAG: ATP-dependent DNA ligase [Gemmatimonadetes bacterium]|nr:MAG: ATP-dependent DNA ligase [Gemmatimonadota bacterium]